MIAARDLIGAPYREGGLSPAEGFDCRTLAWFALTHVLGFQLAAAPFWTNADLGETQALAEGYLDAHAAEWEEMDRRVATVPMPGDVAHLRAPGEPTDHLATCVAPGLFLTTSRATGAVLVPAARLRGVVRLFRYAGAR